MENKTIKFKTNINCGSCVAIVKPFLNDTKGIDHWAVDTDNQDKILSVNYSEISQEEIIQQVQKAGFKIELLT